MKIKNENGKERAGRGRGEREEGKGEGHACVIGHDYGGTIVKIVRHINHNGKREIKT